MKVAIPITKEVELKKVRVTIPIMYGDEDTPYDLPLRVGDIWKADIDIDTGVIEGWPIGDNQPMRLFSKVVDRGTYELFDDTGEMVLSIYEDYVPNGLIPGNYGDYVDLEIDETGRITNWPTDPNFERFLPENDW